MFNLAIDNGELTENPVRKAGTLREDNHTIRYLTIEEEKRLFESIDKVAPYLRPIVTMALQTGMRRGEIFNLKWANIKNGYIELLETKSGKMRTIPISSTLDNVLKNIPRKSIYVFINPKTNKPYIDVKKSWKNVLDKAKISNFRFHDLRHTVATRMVEKGIDLLVVRDILGHSLISTTMRYAHPVTERKQAAIDILNNY
ncbi:site-specific integrase [bacterium]|nr:site-specific integrase [bacterium]